MDKIRIVLVDDMVDITDYFKMIINREKNMTIIGTASSKDEAVQLILEKRPDIILMDVQMEYNSAGIDAISEIKEEWPDAKIIVLTIHDDDESLYEAFAAGAADYLLKTSSITEIISAINAVYENNHVLRANISQRILDEFSRMRKGQESMIYTINTLSKLSKSELAILYSIKGGKTYREVAEERSVEEVTVRTQVSKILKKFGCPRMKTVISRLEKLGIFEMNDVKKLIDNDSEHR